VDNAGLATPRSAMAPVGWLQGCCYHSLDNLKITNRTKPRRHRHLRCCSLPAATARSRDSPKPYAHFYYRSLTMIPDRKKNVRYSTLGNVTHTMLHANIPPICI
jgi:hypothetical protein